MEILQLYFLFFVCTNVYNATQQFIEHGRLLSNIWDIIYWALYLEQCNRSCNNDKQSRNFILLQKFQTHYFTLNTQQFFTIPIE